MPQAESESLLETIARRAGDEPDRIACVAVDEPVRFGNLWQAIERFAAHCRRRGLGRGESVLIALANGFEFFVSFYGIQKAGGVAVPLFPGSGADRLAAVAGLSEARAIVLPSSSPTATDLTAGPKKKAAEIWTVNETSTSPVTGGFPEVGAEELAFIQYTSGSTGSPKGVELTHGNLTTNISQLIGGLEIDEEDVFVSWLPTYHDMGLVLMTMVPFFLGAKLFLLPASARGILRWLDVITRQRATFTAAPDSAYRHVLRTTQRPENFDLSSMRVALNAAEPVRARTLIEFERVFGARRIMTPAYGLAEATVAVSTWSPGTPPKVDSRGFVSVGHAFPDVEITISEAGEILVRSPALCRGYHRNPEATAALFQPDGTLRTGDLGYCDEAGDLFIVGRCKDIIIQAGETIAPQELEEAVDGLAFVRACAAVGLDRGRAEGEQAYLFAEIRATRSSSEDRLRDMTVEIVESIRSRLGFRPGRVYLLRTGALPRTANGKLRRGELKRLYLEGALRQSGEILFPDY